MNIKILTLVLCLIPLSSISQIPVPKNKSIVLYDSLVTYFYGGDYDSLNSTKILFFYDEFLNKIKREHTYFWNQDNNNYYSAERKEYEYDDQGNLVLYIVYYWNHFINDWAGSSKEEHYFSDTLESEILYGSWNEQRREFEGLIKMDWIYDQERRNTGFRTFLWDTLSHNWYYNTFYEIEYSSGNKSIETGFLYDTTINSWTLNTKSQWFYDIKGRDSINISYSRSQEEDELISTSKFEYVYSDSSKVTNAYIRDIQADQWKLYAKYEEIWDSRGNLILRHNLVWNELTSTWGGGYQQTYSFDSLNRMTESIQWKWDNNLSDWIEEYKDFQEFDDTGHRIRTIFYRWQFGWEEVSSTDSIYNSDGNLIVSSYEGYYNDHMFEYFYDDNDILSSYKSYIGNSYNRELWTKGFYYWSKVIIVANTEKENLIKVFPNPASTVLKISGLTGPCIIQIIDLQGIVRLSKHLVNEGEVQIDHLNPGIYLINVKTPEGTITRKIIKN